MDTQPPHQVRGLTEVLASPTFHRGRRCPQGCFRLGRSQGSRRDHLDPAAGKGPGWDSVTLHPEAIQTPRLGPAPHPVPEFVCLSITFENQGEISESQVVDGTMQGYRLEPQGQGSEGPGTSLAGRGVQAVVQPQVLSL